MPLVLAPEILYLIPMEIRPVQEEEFRRWRNAVRASLGDHVSEEDTRFMREHRVELDRLLGCFDGDAIAGSGGADSFDMTLPGGNIVPVAGVAYITTSSTHRRRGIQRRIMRRIHLDARDRGDVAAILWASKSLLYGRYGYGNAMPVHDWEINTDYAQYAHFPKWNGRFIRPDRDEAIPLMTRVYDQARLKRAGMVTRTDKRWIYEIHPIHSKDEFFIVYLEGDEPRAYARYGFKHDTDFAGATNVIEAVSTNDASHAALWRHLLDEDLATTVKAKARPMDDPLYWMLADSRRLKRQLTDGIWLRLLDPAAMIEKRNYAVEGALSIEIRDSESGDSTAFALDGGPDGATCSETSATPDMTMPDWALASAYMGTVSFSMLMNLGFIEVRAKAFEAVRRADAMFRTVPSAWNPHHF